MAAAAPQLALADVANNVSNLSLKVYDDYSQSQARDAALSMQSDLASFEAKYLGRDFIDLADVPEDIDVPRVRKQVVEGGLVEEQPLEQVPAFEVLPALYKKYAEAYADANADKIRDPNTRAEWRKQAQSIVEQSYADYASKSNSQREDFLQRKAMAETDAALESGRFAMARELATNISDPVVRQKYNQEITKSEYAAPIDKLILDPQASVDDIDLAISVLSSDMADIPLSASERAAKINGLEANKKRVMAGVIAENERNRQLQVSDAWLAIDEGDIRVDESYVDALFDGEAIDGPTRTAMIRKINENRDNLVNSQVASAQLDQIASMGYGIDPKDKEMRKQVDVRFGKEVEAGADQWSTAIRYMRQFKVIPSQIAGIFRAANRADSPVLQQAVGLYLQAQDYAPESLADFTGPDVEYIDNVAANVRLGMDIPSAVASVEKYKSLSPEQQATLKRESKDLWDDNQAKLLDMISDFPSYDVPWSVSNPEPNSFMQQEYDALVKRFAPSMGYDIPAAQQKAFHQLTKSWSLSDVNGDWKLMKFMPKAPTGDVRAEIAEAYKGKVAEFKEKLGKTIQYKDIKIVSDSLTQIQIERGMKPTYQAFVVTDADTGEVEMLPRFEWDQAKASSKRRDALLKRASEAAPAIRAREQQQLDKASLKNRIGQPKI